MPHVHLIGAGGIGVSAIGRYYASLGWTVSGSDTVSSTITEALEREGIHTVIGHSVDNLPLHTDLVVHTESIFIAAKGVSHSEASSSNPELMAAKERGLKIESYPQALASITNSQRQIAVTGSHGKSSTTSLIGVMLQGSTIGGSTIVGTQLAQFGGTNYFHDVRSDWFAIEACEYKRHFLEYTPEITVITNIDLDHLDYYRDRDDYISAFVSLIARTRRAVVLSREDIGCQDLYARVTEGDRARLEWYWVDMESMQCGELTDSIVSTSENMGDRESTVKVEGHTGGFGEPRESVGEPVVQIPFLALQVPGEHLRLDANLAYTVGEIIGIPESERIEGLTGYRGSWRRSEIVGVTLAGNTVISDYGHHPSEIRPTLAALRAKYSGSELVVVFQPHQHSRTRGLLDEFATAFTDADRLIIPDIYASRDTPEDIAYMTTARFVATVGEHHSNIIDGGGLAGT